MSTTPTQNQKATDDDSVSADHGKFQEVIDELSEELAYNYMANSFGDNYNMEIAHSSDIFQKKADVFEGRIASKQRVRNIMVIGAGVSYDAYKCIPLGEQLIEEMREEYETKLKTIDFLENKFEQEKEEIIDITGKSVLNFENYLYLLSKHFVLQKELREKMKQMTGFRYSVSLFNEIVAHLLKHSFLDVVINFNFEEQLDIVVEEEIGKHNYHNIISDGNCVGLNEMLVDGRLKMPVYIKPHGTFSHKSTLRFTNRHYFDLPNDLKIMLEDLISGERGKKPIERVNLIVVGFNLESLEFNKIINKKLPWDSCIYHFDFNAFETLDQFFKQRNFFNDFLARAASKGRKAEEIYRPLNTSNFSQNKHMGGALTNVGQTVIDNKKNGETEFEGTIPINDGEKGNRITPTFGELFSVIWRSQNEYFSKAYKPRSIARHEITSYLFYLPHLGLNCQKEKANDINKRLDDRRFMQENIETHPKYFRDRVMVELFLLLNRNNGILDIAEILKGRTGTFYNRYRQACLNEPTKIKHSHSLHELLDDFVKGEGLEKRGVKSPQKMFDVPEYANGKHIFILQSDFTSDDFENKKIFEDKLKDLVAIMIAHLRELRVPQIHSHISFVELGRRIDAFSERLMTIVLKWYDDEITQKIGSGVSEKTDRENEKLKIGRTISLFLRLLNSEMVSTYFKFNFILNHDKEIFNGTITDSAYIKYNDKRIMLSELFRLLAKSWSHHYFIIDPAPVNPVHHIWESFSKRKLIHTNLGRSAEFNQLFKSKDWDVFLSITETGSLLNFLHHYSKDQGDEIKVMQDKLRHKHFLIICSYESIRQLYPETLNKEDLLKKHKNHLRAWVKDDEYIIPEENLTVFAVPFNIHNHHLSVFLQRLDNNDNLYENLKTKFTIITRPEIEESCLTTEPKPKQESALKLTPEQEINEQPEIEAKRREPENEIDKDLNILGKQKYFFLAIGSIYKYRSGFSNSIDPLYIGLADNEATNDRIYRDQVKLIDTFTTHLSRGFEFEMLSRRLTGDKDNFWDKPEYLKKLQHVWEYKHNELKAPLFLQVIYNYCLKDGKKGKV